jgi:hypothetical protein
MKKRGELKCKDVEEVLVEVPEGDLEEDSLVAPGANVSALTVVIESLIN